MTIQRWDRLQKALLRFPVELTQNGLRALCYGRPVANPDDLMADNSLQFQYDEVFILGNNGGTGLLGIIPDFRVLGAAHIKIEHMVGSIADGKNELFQGERKLCVDQKTPHSVARMIGWSFDRAA
jgi:hypothetical protein